MSTSTTKPDMFKHPKGTFERLNDINYASWQNNMQRLLRSIHCWNITCGTEKEPTELQGPNISNAAKNKNLEDIEKYNNRLEDGAAAIYNSCSVSIRIHINKMFHPKDMWNELAEKVNTASTEVGRQGLNREFQTLRPVPGAPINDFFIKLIEIQDQLQDTAEEINDATFKSHVLGVLPTAFDVTVQIQRGTPGTTVQSIRAALIEEERNQALRQPPPATTEAHYTSSGSKKRSKKWCSYCRMTNHNLEECFKHKRQNPKTKTVNQDNASDQEVCYHCGKDGHQWNNCLVRKAGKEAREKHRAKRVRKDDAQTTNDHEEIKPGL